jgi:hypothetical protein
VRVCRRYTFLPYLPKAPGATCHHTATGLICARSRRHYTIALRSAQLLTAPDAESFARLRTSKLGSWRTQCTRKACNYMGLDSDCIKFLATARLRGCSLGTTLTIGKQEISDGRMIAKALGVAPPEGDSSRFADWVLRGLGATSVRALDASAYEGADFVHDLNTPLPAEHHQSFDTVVDSGTLEHVFDTRQSFANLMQLTRVGGNVFLVLPANNQMGHGFYQFSPELFFRVFSASNGFEVRRLVVQPYTLRRPAYEVADPASVGQRVGLITSAPVRLFVHAVRTRDCPVLANAPQQSDYSIAWARGTRRGGSANGLARKAYHAVVARMPPHVRDVIYRVYYAMTQYTLRNRKFFTPTTL